MLYKISKKIPFPKMGRHHRPLVRFAYNESTKFPIKGMKVGDSFKVLDHYDYGITLSVKNMVRKRANKLGLTNFKFAVGNYKGTIRVWRKI